MVRNGVPNVTVSRIFTTGNQEVTVGNRCLLLFSKQLLVSVCICCIQLFMVGYLHLDMTWNKSTAWAWGARPYPQRDHRGTAPGARFWHRPHGSTFGRRRGRRWLGLWESEPAAEAAGSLGGDWETTGAAVLALRNVKKNRKYIEYKEINYDFWGQKSRKKNNLSIMNSSQKKSRKVETSPENIGMTIMCTASFSGYIILIYI